MRALVTALALSGAALLAPSAPALAQQTLVPCAREGGFCRVPYPTRVIYGVPGRTRAADVRGRGVECTNEVFGDPAYGVPKRCAYVARRGYDDEDDEPVARWRTCAAEDDYCEFRGRKRVRYGARGRYAEGVFRNGVDCDNDTFGDPLPGVRKSCQVLD
ncbi:hypothetical protein [Salinarimonas soli]|uniref:Uncharacterized protein n=1 Tax=Salinarimonas soli TaxID=1638099 RepID=A0A5B2V8T8_9HYPH|nr:hypothetical protein [Salinarimonas soli]KAA2235158.1 hypothetical protein F0L46_20650 [Salinarimonas soli]